VSPGIKIWGKGAFVLAEVTDWILGFLLLMGDKVRVSEEERERQMEGRL
jgi:hypothetical protein